MRNFVTRFLSAILLATSIGFTVVLIFIGYEVAIMLMEAGAISGQVSIVAITALPSLFALGSVPFWLVLRRMTQNVETE